MTMLDIMKGRLPEGLEIAAVKERTSRFEIAFTCKGEQVKGYLPKACQPGYGEKIADFTICAAMMEVGLRTNNMEMAKDWMRKQNEAVELQ